MEGATPFALAAQKLTEGKSYDVAEWQSDRPTMGISDPTITNYFTVPLFYSPVEY